MVYDAEGIGLHAVLAGPAPARVGQALPAFVVELKSGVPERPEVRERRVYGVPEMVIVAQAHGPLLCPL